MHMFQKLASIGLAAVMAASMASGVSTAYAADTDGNDDNLMFGNSDFIETEQPELDEETKTLISLYKRQPTMENYLALRDKVMANYDAVLVRKEAKLEELKIETAGKPGSDERVAEMREIVQEMYMTYWNRINSSMLRFTDPRMLDWSVANASQYDYIPVMGAGETVYVSYTQVTNGQYAAFIADTGYHTPENWENSTYAAGEEDFPVNYVSFADAQAYCVWLTENDPDGNTYRLPNESEWELAAGHMPKDANFNCGINDGRTSVYEYEGVTRGAHGALDFWGNVWEWTSTQRASDTAATILGVKGGSYCSERTDCRTEHRKEGRNASQGYADVGFRVFQILGGVEPEQKVELATLDAPDVRVTDVTTTSITLSWEPVEEAVEYQLFSYDKETGLVAMLDHIADTTVVMDGLEPGSTHCYIVQPISYVEICDNVSAEYAVEATCLTEGAVVTTDADATTTAPATTTTRRTTTTTAASTTTATRRTTTTTAVTTTTTVTTGSTTAAVPGDFNGDGTFGLQDIVLLQRWLLGWADSGQVNWACCDLNGDGMINIYDLALLKRYLLETF